MKPLGNSYIFFKVLFKKKTFAVVLNQVFVLMNMQTTMLEKGNV